MAIVFVSPHKKRRIFLLLTAWAFGVAMVVLAVFAILPEINHRFRGMPIAVNESLKSAKEIKINFNTVDSGAVMELEKFILTERVFSYVAKNQNGKEVKGSVVATTSDNAAEQVRVMGFTVVSISEERGRTEPFAPYY